MAKNLRIAVVGAGKPPFFGEGCAFLTRGQELVDLLVLWHLQRKASPISKSLRLLQIWDLWVLGSNLHQIWRESWIDSGPGKISNEKQLISSRRVSDVGNI